MFFLNGTPVLASVSQIMYVLQRELRIEGSPLLKDIKTTRYEHQDIVFTCPYHKHGQESKPSCGITVVDKERNGRKIQAGTFGCFTCKKHGDITELISYCFGKNDGGVFGKQWILDHFNNYDVENREGFLHLFGKKEEKKQKYVTEEELQKYRYTHPYMYKRGLTDEIIDIFDVGYDKDFRLREDLNPIPCVTFPVRDYDGNVVFIARRSVKGKVFSYPSNLEKPIYGLYEVQHIFKDSRELWICESIFNALTLIKWGKPAVAMLGTGTFLQIEKLKDMEYRKYHIITDGDEAGRNSGSKLYKALHTNKFIERIDMPDGKDVNDFRDCETYEEFLEEKERRN